MKPRKIVKVRMEKIQLEAHELEVLQSYETNPEQQKRVCKMAERLQMQGQLQPICLNEDCTVI